MTRVASLSLLAVLAVGSLGCPGEDEPDPTPPQTPGEAVVRVTLENFVLEPGQTATASASTVNGEDSAYSFTSSAPAVATVDAATGLVTGVSVGEAEIAATGADSGATGSAFVVVVVEGFDPTVLPNYAAWLSSGHANRESEAFRHWDGDEPPVVPASCARCHSAGGYLDYLGADGSAAGTVDAAANTDTVVSCQTCHDPAAVALTEVTYPSGITVPALGATTRCEVCHQGRESSVSVDTAIANAGGDADPDAVAMGLTFRNPHYAFAGATLRGAQVRGGYEYAGKTYDVRFQHAGGLDSCGSCHDPHSSEVKAQLCETCHAGAGTEEGMRAIRMIQSRSVDYDGDGDQEEGIYGEIETLRTQLLSALQAYASSTSGLGAICYDEGAFPYWFKDTDGDGTCSATEAVNANGFRTWSPRLLRGAYNFQFATKDHGAYAHNGKYLIQLLHDSIEDLGGDVSSLGRDDPGHFNGSSHAFRNWDAAGAVPANCSKCHGGAQGLRTFLDTNATAAVPAMDVNGLQCETCHASLETWALVDVPRVTFPGNVVISDNAQLGAGDRLCASCHSGRQSKATIDAAIAAGNLGSFLNVHYAPAAGTLMGTVTGVGYEYPGKTYAEKFRHSGGARCESCHRAADTEHTFHVEDAMAHCAQCHTTADEPADIRWALTEDYDGDGDATEPLAEELKTLEDALLAQLVAVTGGGAAGTLCYAHANPYFFQLDAAGVCQSNAAGRFTPWTPALLQAAHNYQFSHNEHGAWAHNFRYMAQLLIDSIENLGGDVSSFTRPPPQPQP